jgi:hypothetical protein
MQNGLANGPGEGSDPEHSPGAHAAPQVVQVPVGLVDTYA